MRARIDRRRASVRLLASAVLVLLFSGCAWTEYRAWKSAQADHEECLERFPDSPERCTELRNAVDARFREYERAGRARWSCDRDSGECFEAGL